MHFVLHISMFNKLIGDSYNRKTRKQNKDISKNIDKFQLKLTDFSKLH